MKIKRLELGCGEGSKTFLIKEPNPNYGINTQFYEIVDKIIDKSMEFGDHNDFIFDIYVEGKIKYTVINQKVTIEYQED